MADFNADDILSSAVRAAFASAGRAVPRILRMHAVSGGSISRAFRLHTSQGEYFCKWNPDGPADMYQREKEGLEALAAAGSSLIIPRVIGLAAPGDTQGSPLLLLEYLEPARETGRYDWERLGRGLAELHRCGSGEFGFAADNYCGATPQDNTRGRDWGEFYARRRIGALLDRLDPDQGFGGSPLRNGARMPLGHPRSLTLQQARDFRRLVEKLPALLGHGPAASLIHGDLWSGNFLACTAGPALIDPAVYHADREAEWGMMLLFGGFPETVLDAYQEAWALPAGWRDRIPLYQLYHVLNHYLLFGGGYGEQALRIAKKYL